MDGMKKSAYLFYYIINEEDNCNFVVANLSFLVRNKKKKKTS